MGDQKHLEAEENFKARFGHYPIRVDLPEPTLDPVLDALVARWARRGDPPKLKAIPSPDRGENDV